MEIKARFLTLITTLLYVIFASSKQTSASPRPDSQTSEMSCYKQFDSGQFKHAFKSCKQLAEQGDIIAMALMGDMYFLVAVEQLNMFAALDYYRLPAQAGYPPAQFKFGLLLNPYFQDTELNSFDQSIKKLNTMLAKYDMQTKQLNATELVELSLRWIEKAAFNDEPNANLYLGRRALSQSKHHRRDEEKALRYLNKALALGHESAAELIIGINNARQHFQAELNKAKTGDSKAQHEVAKAYQDGIGTQTNQARHSYWAARAQQQNKCLKVTCR